MRGICQKQLYINYFASMLLKLSFFIICILLLEQGCAPTHGTLLYQKAPSFYSYIFGNIKNNKIIVQHEADVYTSIASCQKTIFALLAYKTLGIDYRYETKLNVVRKNHKIQDIIISFTGDPTLKTENLLQLLRPINGLNIDGNILLDASLFKTSPISPNLMIDDVGTEYAQPVSSIIIDENLINIKIEITRKKTILITNDSGYLTNSCITITSEPTLLKASMHNDIIKIDGNINVKEEKSIKLKVSPVNFDRFILYKVKKALRQEKIKGKVMIVKSQDQLPKKSATINIIKSENLKNVIPSAIKRSDNLVFDSLYLKLIHTYSTCEIESWNDGDKIIKKLIYKYFNINMENCNFVDGSGLSRYNKIQPKKLFYLLKQGYYLNEFVDSLPSPGEQGSTLANRTDLLKTIKAKTGNISGISCLCGYNLDKHPKAFVMVANSFSPPNKQMFTILDSFVNNFATK
jgi:serine-type D-Ala-D-Ala carboxypeptidase/endopeptidase (penicillin-binding protein 4)